MKELNDGNFVNETSNGVSFIDFWAPWCGPCVRMSPTIEYLANDNPNLVVAKVNVDDNPETSKSFHVRNIPTMVFLKEGKEVKRLVGYQSIQDMQKVIDELMDEGKHNRIMVKSKKLLI